ncbi:MAG: MAB_1171c family putative transporter [Gordonia sp. (in: high G+C Gram-positive bacteria)]|uniref:MAB_1171c family putative transporter n=1 Tax=Gordonia sp. (in: high G+C Gram-positive bacteria) TaxID=84139 RepID=UPI003BB62D95
MSLLLTARLKWCRTNLYDCYYTNLMALVLIAQLLREHAVEDALTRGALMSVTTAQQLAFVAMIFASTELIGFTMLWTGLSPSETRRCHRYYRAAAVGLCIAFLVAATRARIAGLTLETSGGWDAVVAWALYLTMILALSARVMWMFGQELRKSTRRREFVLAAGGLLLGVVTAAGCLEALLLALTDQLGWTDTLEFRRWFHGFEFFGIALAVFALGTVTVASRLIGSLGLDHTSRAWRGLQPLRTSMVTITPECGFDVAHPGEGRRQKTTLQLHHTIIEIRDALLHLRRYSHPASTAERTRFLSAHHVPPREHATATRAYEFALAARAKDAGAPPGPNGPPPDLRLRSTTLSDEAKHLLALAKWWTPAYAATVRPSAANPDVKASPLP